MRWRRLRQSISLAMAVVMSLGLMPMVVAGGASEQAYAADSYLQVGGKLRYAGYSTRWYFADDEMAYCGQPSKKSPQEGVYAKEAIAPQGRAEWTSFDISKMLFYGYGGPGFDWGVAHGIWPNTWYDGTPLDAEKYVALTHIVLSDMLNTDFDAATHGCYSDFVNWGEQNILAYWPEYHPDSIQARVIGAPLPADFPDYCFQLSTGGSTQVMLGRSPYNPFGSIKVSKTSSSAGITADNDCYSFQGGVYGVYEDEECTIPVGEVKLDESGVGTLDVLCNGWTYYVKEISSPTGYLANDAVYPVTPVRETQNVVDVSDVPRKDTELAHIAKRDQDLSVQLPEGAATLEGAEFTFRYYDGYYTASNLPSTPTRSWVMKTNASGVASPFAGESMKTSGDEFFTEEGNVVVPLGTVAVVESKAPEGYNLDDGSGGVPRLFVMQIVADDSKPSGARIEAVSYSGDEIQRPSNAPIASDSVKRGNLEGTKVDSATEDGKAQGAATLAGAKIVVESRNRGNVVSPQTGKSVGYGGVVCTLTTDEDGAFSTTAESINGWRIPDGTDASRVDGLGNPLDFRGKALAYGEYRVYEASPPEGYLKNTEWSEIITVSEDGQVVVTGFDDDIKRGDIEFTKASGVTQKRLVNVPFVIASKTTGEAHVVVTDANGMVSTESSFNAHAQATNANDAAVSMDAATGQYVVNESALVSEAGIWFTGHGGTGGAPVDDALGALPYDTYVVQEVRCPANDGLELATFEVVVSRHGRTLDMGTVDDQPSPFIGTTLLDAEGTHTAAPGSAVTLIDTIAYMNFQPGSYTFRGELHAVDDEGSDCGVVAETVRQVVLPGGVGSVEVAFTVNAAEYASQGLHFVAFETCYDEEGALVAEHQDLSDEFQTVLNPHIGTTLTDLADGDHEAPSAGAVTLTDEVSYSGLTPEKSYTLAMVVHKVAPDGSDAGELADADGNVVAATQEFVPEAESGVVNISVTFIPDGGGYDAVAFEELSRGSTTYAVHADIADQAQTVHMPAIFTEAIDAHTTTHATALGEDLKLVDTVSYRNLTPGMAYEITGTVHIRNADGSDAGVLKDEDGTDLVTSASFVPEDANGTVKLDFAAPVVLEAGQSAVVYEVLTHADDGAVMAEHADLHDDAQSVQAPKLGTSAVDSASGSHYAGSVDSLVIIDAVAYENLPVGIEYTLRGSLHGVSEEGDDAGVLADAHGVPMEEIMTFVPDEPNGVVELRFEADPDDLAASTVVFEELLVRGEDDLVKVAEHADISDEGQTVHIAQIATTASDKRSGTHEGRGMTSATITDVVAYEGLEPDGLYRLEGTLYDKVTGEPFLDGDAAVTSELNFSAHGPADMVAMDFNVTNSSVDGHTLVVFERLYDASGKVVAIHEDIDSADQSVHYVAPPLGGVFDKTGYWLAEYWWVLLIAGAGLLLVGAFRFMASDRTSVFNAPNDEREVAD